MDRDSIKEFLESRYKELSQNETLPPLKDKEKLKEVVETPKVKNNKTKKSFYVFVVIFTLLGLIFFGYEVYGRWHIKQGDQNEVLLKRVGLLTDLPTSETPTIATVTNANMLKNQVFFKEVINGDKVIIYNIAKKAVLYRPSTGKVVSITSIN